MKKISALILSFVFAICGILALTCCSSENGGEMDASLEIVFSEYEKVLKVGETTQINASIDGGEGMLYYESSNSSVIIVSSTGLVKAESVGQAQVTVMVSGHQDTKKTLDFTVISASDETEDTQKECEHDFVNGRYVSVDNNYHAKKCAHCDELDAASKASHQVGSAATCGKGDICKDCQLEYTSKLEHDYSVWDGNSTQHWKKCSWCEEADMTTAADHTNPAPSGPTASCTACNQTYAVVNAHLGHCVCGSDELTTGAHSHTAITEWTAWDEAASADYKTALPTKAGYWYLTDDVVLSAQQVVSGNVTICFNGKKVTGTGGVAGMIKSGSADTVLTFTDCKGGGSIRYTGAEAVTGGGVIFSSMHTNADINIFGGSFGDDSGKTHKYGIIYVNGWKGQDINIYGGNVTGSKGGTIYLRSPDGELNIYGGSISGGDRTASSDDQNKYGGNIFTTAELTTAKINISGGTVSGGKATYGGNIYIDCTNSTSVELNITGGAVLGGEVNQYGGNIYFYKSGAFKVTGGTITGGKATEGGSGIYSTEGLTVGGNAKIIGNVGDNIYIPKTKTVTVDQNGFSDGAMIGVKLSEPSADAKVATGAMYGQENFFVSNNAAYKVTFDESDSTLKLTERTRYTISDKTALNDLRTYPEGYFTLANDIDLGGAAWTPIASFSGTLDGAGHTIGSFTLTSNSESGNIGFFRTMSGTVMNLNFENVTVSAKEGNNAGIVAGTLDGSLDKVHVRGSELTVDGETVKADGLVGVMNGSVTECFADVAVMTKGESERRDTAVDYMNAMASVTWTPSEELTNSCSCGHNYTLYPGTTYTGMVYAHKGGSLESLLYYLDKTDNTVKGVPENWQQYLSNDCADSVYWAMSKVSGTITFKETADMLIDKYVKAVGGYEFVTTNEDRRNHAAETFTALKGDGSAVTLQQLYEYYAQLRKGDALLQPGHVVLVTANAYVYRNADGSIDAAKSYVLFTEQGGTANFGRPEPTDHSMTKNKKITFAEMVTSRFIPLTINEYKDGATESTARIESLNVTASGYITGKVTSNYRINYITVQIKGADGAVKKEQSVFPFNGVTTASSQSYTIVENDPLYAGLTLEDGDSLTLYVNAGTERKELAHT